MLQCSTIPNLFIIGAPKCGTTALWHLLKSHPQCYMSALKEPLFFASFYEARPVKTIRSYLKLFRDAVPGVHHVIGEASVLYYLKDEVVSSLLRFNPQARIILLVRDPVDFVVSWHAQLLRTGDETVADFETAWSLQNARAQGQYIPKSCRCPLLLQYDHIARLGTRAQVIQRLVPPSQLLIIHQHDLRDHPGEVLQRLERFLGITGLAGQQPSKKNIRALPRSVRLAVALNRAHGIWRTIKTALGINTGLGLYELAMALNSKPSNSSTSVTPNFHAFLVSHFRSERLAVSTFRLRRDQQSQSPPARN